MSFRESFENSSIPSQEKPEEIEKENQIQETKERLEAKDRDAKIKSFVNELSKEKGYIDFNKLKKIGEGGTHDVFINPQNQEFVIKLDRDALGRAIDLGQSELPLEARNAVEQYINKQNEKNNQLYKYFGKEHCLQETTMVQKLSIEKNGINKNIEGMVSIQELSNIFKDPNKKDFGTSYILNEKSKSIFELADRDADFKNSLREFLLKFKDYYEATGNFIDLVGKDNVLFNQQEGKWNFTLGSVAKGDNIETLREAIMALDREPEILNQDEYLRNQLMNGLATSQLLNSAGLKVGIGRIINFQLSEKQSKNLEKIKFKYNNHKAN
jgi:hypothetical protein